MSCMSTGSALEPAPAGAPWLAAGASSGGADALAALAGGFCACTAAIASISRMARPGISRRWDRGMQVTPLNLRNVAYARDSRVWQDVGQPDAAVIHRGHAGATASAMLAQPAARVHRLAALAQLEIRPGVAVHAHPAVAVVDDDQHAVTAQEAGIDDPPPRHRVHLAAGRGLDQHAVAVAVHHPAGRPRQMAADVGADAAGCGWGRLAASRRGAGFIDRLLQLVEQMVERLRILLHRGQALRLVLVTGIRRRHQFPLRGALLRQFLHLLLAVDPGCLQCLLLSRDRGFQLLQTGQVAHQFLYALHAVALEILRIDQGAGDP